jgi:hypothetical protein
MRNYSSTQTNLYSFDGAGSSGLELNHWPITKSNTILNIVPQGNKYVVERLGKMSAIQESGYFFAIPFIDQISYVIDARERAIRIEPQSAITRDNVSVDVSGNLFVQFVDAEKAAYGARNPLYSVMQVRYLYHVYFISNISQYFAHLIITMLSFLLSTHNQQ